MDGWCYCFNVPDIFTKQWLSYRFDTLATNDVAIESIVEAVSAAKPECANLTLQCDIGSQYTSRNFRKAVSLLGIHLKFIWNHTPQQNGHIESFHNTLKREYTGRTTCKTLCVAVISATVVPALLDLRVDNTLPRMRAFVRLTRGMRIVKYRFDGEWEFSAGQVRYTAKEVRICITLE